MLYTGFSLEFEILSIWPWIWMWFWVSPDGSHVLPMMMTVWCLDILPECSIRDISRGMRYLLCIVWSSNSVSISWCSGNSPLFLLDKLSMLVIFQIDLSLWFEELIQICYYIILIVFTQSGRPMRGTNIARVAHPYNCIFFMQVILWSWCVRWYGRGDSKHLFHFV